MKKKFLALALAAAVMAPTTSAFAATIGGNDTETHEGNITINGSVRKSDGSAAAGKIEVELPATANFTVDQEGNFIGSNFSIINRSSTAVDVKIGSFLEENRSGGIVINNQLTNDASQASNSNHISQVGRNTIRLQLDGVANGVSETVDLHEGVKDASFITIPKNDTAEVQVSGLAGIKKEANEAVENGGVSENFTVKFKISKA